jgi:hypothetical protein
VGPGAFTPHQDKEESSPAKPGEQRSDGLAVFSSSGSGALLIGSLEVDQALTDKPDKHLSDLFS